MKKMKTTHRSGGEKHLKRGYTFRAGDPSFPKHQTHSPQSTKKK